MSHISRSVRLSLLTGLLVALMPLLTGCGALTPTAGPANSFVTEGALSGKVHGGNQPIAGATISLYAAGTSGYGSAGVLYAQTTSATDGTGSFSFTQTTSGSPTGPPASITSTYGCPTGSTTNPNPQMYLISSGGATQGYGNGTNSAAVFITALGPCSGVGSLYVNLNEVTSVATMAALQQYFNPMTESFGYPTADAAYFANGQAAIANLVNIETGAAVSSTAYSATPAGSTNTVTVTVTPEVAQINTIADILAACVNNTSNTAGNCTTLFTDAVPPNPAVTSQASTATYTTSTVATDTLQALYFMLANPTSGLSSSNMNGLFALSNAQSPFQSNYSTAPTDWTIAVLYSSSSKCTLASGDGTTNTTQTFLGGVNDPAIDSEGDLWADAVGSNGGLFEISPIGKPLTCALGSLADTPTPAVIDTAGNVWVGSGVTHSSYYHFYEWSPSGSYTAWPTSTTNAPQSAAADGYGNVFYADAAASSAGNLNEFAGAATASSASSPTTIATLGTTSTFMAVDSLDNIWVTDTVQSLTSSGLTASIYDVYPSNNTTGPTYEPGTSNGSYTGFQTGNIVGSTTGTDSQIYSPYGIAVRTLNNSGVFSSIVYSSNGAGSGGGGHSYEWTTLTPTGPGTATVADSTVELAGNYAVRAVAVDGAGNVWQGNNNAASGNWVTGAATSGLYNVCEISATGAAISATSATGTGTYGTDTGSFQKPAAFLPAGVRGVAIDSTGNVWVGQNTSSATTVMELVGQGVPVVTPLSYAAQQNKLGQMP